MANFYVRPNIIDNVTRFTSLVGSRTWAPGDVLYIDAFKDANVCRTTTIGSVGNTTFVTSTVFGVPKVGMLFRGPGVANGTYITAVSGTAPTYTLTLSSPSTAAWTTSSNTAVYYFEDYMLTLFNRYKWVCESGGTTTVPDVWVPSSINGVSASITAGTMSGAANTITSATVVGAITIGMSVTGTNIAAGTWITDIQGSTITLNQNPTGTFSTTLTVTGMTNVPMLMYINGGTTNANSSGTLSGFYSNTGMSTAIAGYNVLLGLYVGDVVSDPSCGNGAVVRSNNLASNKFEFGKTAGETVMRNTYRSDVSSSMAILWNVVTYQDNSTPGQYTTITHNGVTWRAERYGESWSNPLNSLFNASRVAYDGDTIYMNGTDTDAPGFRWYTTNGTLCARSIGFSVATYLVGTNDVVNMPPTSKSRNSATLDLSAVTNANFIVFGFGAMNTVGSAILLGGFGCYGLTISLPSVASTNNIFRLHSGDNNNGLHGHSTYDSCTFTVNNSTVTGTALLYAPLNTSKLTTKRCVFNLQSSQKIEFAAWDSEFDTINGSTGSNGLIRASGGYLNLNGLDTRSITSPLTRLVEFVNGDSTIQATITNSSIHSNTQLHNTLYKTNGSLLASNVNAGDNHYGFYHTNGVGKTTSDVSVYLNNGAKYDGTNPVSWKIDTTPSSAVTVISQATPYVSPWISVYCDTTSTIQPWIEILKTGASPQSPALFNEIIAEWSFHGTSGASLANSAISGHEIPSGNSISVESSSATWSGTLANSWTGRIRLGSNTYNSAAATISNITPAELGYLRVRFIITVPNLVFYVDPIIRGK